MLPGLDRYIVGEREMDAAKLKMTFVEERTKLCTEVACLDWMDKSLTTAGVVQVVREDLVVSG